MLNRRDPIRHFLTAAAYLAAFAFPLGCSPRAGDVEIHVGLEDVPRLSGLTLVALPYDAVAILDSLERAAEAPRPEFPQLESTLNDFRRRVPPELTQVYADWTAARRHVETLSDTLSGLDRESAQYAAAYQRFRDQYERLATKEAELERATRDLSAEDRELASAAAAAADTLRKWEESAFQDYGAIAGRVLSESGRAELELDQGEPGAVSVRLEPGSWWFVASLPHPDNPFREFFWNVPIRVDGLTPLQVPLSDRNVTLRWRH